jgi:hypothetical protein
MTLSGNLPRRVFLQMLLSLNVYALSRPACSYAPQEAPHFSDPLPSKLASFFLHKQSAKNIGLEYLKVAPMEADISLLSNLICSFDGDYRVELLHADSGGFRELLRQRLCVDFEQGDIVIVNGWLLAATEARLCALTALLS